MFTFMVVGDILFRFDVVTGHTWRCDGWNWHEVKEPNVTAKA